MKKNTLRITLAAVIAAVYVALTLLINAFDLANGAIQVRVSEALTVLPYFTPAAIPGLTIGCLLANIFTGCAAGDIIFGTFATLLGAIGTYCIGKLSVCKKKGAILCTLPPVIANTLIVPFVLKYVYGMPQSIPVLMGFLAIGEIISCCILGGLLLGALRKSKVKFEA